VTAIVDDPMSADAVIRWLNPPDAKTRKRRQALQARFETMTDEQQGHWLKRQLRYLRTRAETDVAMMSSLVNAAVPGTPQWQQACEARRRAVHQKETLDALLCDLDRLDRKATLRLVSAPEERQKCANVDAFHESAGYKQLAEAYLD
jgi:hypothetical protein